MSETEFAQYLQPQQQQQTFHIVPQTGSALNTNLPQQTYQQSYQTSGNLPISGNSNSENASSGIGTSDNSGGVSTRTSKRQPRGKNLESLKKNASPPKKPARKPPTNKKPPVKKEPSPKKETSPPKKAPPKKNAVYVAGDGRNKPSFSDRPIQDMNKESWKLFRKRKAIIWHLCTKCDQDLYKDVTKYQNVGNRHIAKVAMCQKCALSNILMNNAYYLGFEADGLKSKNG